MGAAMGQPQNQSIHRSVMLSKFAMSRAKCYYFKLIADIFNKVSDKAKHEITDTPAIRFAL